MSKVALIIIYNHQYNKNINILENLYGERFSDIYHIVPFYNGEKNNVIPVYENSFYFSGYVSQGFKGFFRKEYVHYFFIADDLILNPSINESNYDEYLKLGSHTCFLPEFLVLHERERWWPRIGEAYYWSIDIPGIEAKEQLPCYESALAAFNAFGLEIKPLRFQQVWRPPFTGLRKDKFYPIRYFINRFSKKKYHLSYPIIGSYSDIFVVSSDAIKQFCHFCGVFAATRLHVEVALPTSLVLSAEKIVTEKDLTLQGKALWAFEKADAREIETYRSKGSLKQLLEDFPPSYLYLHPIKLSQWSCEL
jgi:hypothetical protein